MKKLILTSTAFVGEVTIIYDDNSKLVLIDMINSELTEEQLQHLKHFAPARYNDLDSFKAAFRSSTLRVIEGDYKVTFDMFWNKYGLKRNRDRAEKLWDKLSETNKVKAYTGLNSYLRFLALNTWRTKAQPDTYLKEKYWENEWK